MPLIVETILLLILMAAGAVACAAAGRALTVRFRLPWREALMYFGLAPYPDER